MACVNIPENSPAWGHEQNIADMCGVVLPIEKPKDEDAAKEAENDKDD